MRRVLTSVMLFGVLMGGCSGSDSDEAAMSAVDSAEDGDAGEEFDESGMAAEEAALPAAAGATAAPAAEGEDAAGVGEGGVALPAAVRPADRIIKEGTMSIKTGADEFDAAFQRVVEIAQGLGGGVAASSTAVADDGYTTGSLTVRVPVESYEQLLVGVGEIGDVTNRQVSSQDVSEEFVDLEARRRQLRVQEEFYVGLLAETTSVQDAVTVREELDRIQADIERITGRLNLLEDRTSFSTLTVEIFEPGAPTPAVQAGSARDLSGYWQTGLDALVAAVGTIVVVTLGVLPLAVILLIVFVVVRAFRRRPRPSERPV